MPDYGVLLDGMFVEDGDEIILEQSKLSDRHRKIPRATRQSPVGIELFNVGFVTGQLGKPAFPRPAIVGNVVGGAAKRINVVHRLALWPRKNAHSRVE